MDTLARSKFVELPARPVLRADWLAPAVVTGSVGLFDAVTVLAAGLATWWFRFGTVTMDTASVYGLFLAVLLTVNALQLTGSYSFYRLFDLGAQATRVLWSWSLVFLLLIAFGFATRSLDDISRLWIGVWYLSGLAAILAMRCLVRGQLMAWRARGILSRNIVVVGAGEHGRRLVEHLRRLDRSVRLIGLFDDRSDRVPGWIEGFPVLGGIEELIPFARRHRIDQIVVALPWSAEQRLLTCMRRLRELPVEIRLCPDMVGFSLPGRGVSHLGGIPMLHVYEKPLTGWDLILKSVEDRVAAGAILFGVAPLMLVIAALVRLSSPGPILFRQQRYGFNNELIEVYKFRSMRVGEPPPPSGDFERQATRDDPRITPVGGFLRKTSLDELPQLFNVLRGEMSIVGPRPHAVSHNEHYAKLIDEYLARHRVKPGITGWAQIHGYRGETDTLDKMRKRVQFDLDYIENWSLMLDLRIIVRTLFVGFRHPNAY